MWPTKWLPLRKLEHGLPGTLFIFGYWEGNRWVTCASTNHNHVVGAAEYTHFVSIPPPPRRKA